MLHLPFASLSVGRPLVAWRAVSSSPDFVSPHFSMNFFMFSKFDFASDRQQSVITFIISSIMFSNLVHADKT
jgi:hypothetical protein